MKSQKPLWMGTIAIFAVLATSVPLAAGEKQNQQHHHYKLLVLGTLGGPQSYGDPGHGAANINNAGFAVGVSDTSTPDPFYPNFNPGLTNLIGSYPYVYHAFVTRGGSPVDLGGLPGGTDSVVSSVSGDGLITGEALNGSIDPLTSYPEENAVLWRDGQIVNLGTFGGGESAAGRVNSRAQVAGIAANTVADPYSLAGWATQTRTFLWDERSGMQDIGTLGGPDAFGGLINERGQIAGFSYTSTMAVDPFLWEKGQMIDLGTLGGTSGGPADLNNKGQVAGTSNLVGDVDFHPFLWTAPGPMRDLGTLGGATGLANAINDAGEVIGYADTPASTHAYIWKNGKMTDLGTLTGDCFSGAFGINSRTQVVGQSITCDFTGFRAFLWENGSMIDLNVFVPSGSNLTLTDVETINDRGEMFGEAVLADGSSRAFLLIPCEEGTDGCIDVAEAGATTRNIPARSARIPTASIQRYLAPAGIFGARHARLGQPYRILGRRAPRD
jgi:probable HAF family extracellular repeat protein